MKSLLVILPILIPIICGAIVPLFHFEESKKRERYVSSVVIINTILIFALFAAGIRGESIQIAELTDKITIGFRVDGMSMVFGGLLAGLWPLATFYAYEYMRHEGKENAFFSFYTITYGVAVGIAFSANLLTMYLFYELLTLVTLPIIMHEMDEKAMHAGRKYLIYSVTGAAFAFMGIMILLHFSGTTEFVYGGVLANGQAVGNETILRFGYLLTFFGFGVKAAVFPFHGWLPTAGVAPTPVTALLHAVAVVKAGVFAIIRVTYYSFGTALLLHSKAHYIVLGFTMFTIVYGSAMAVREQHLKRRLAYSTVSNLSYILFGVTLMTPQGLAGALSHMIFHGIMKICLFFCAGAVICKTHKYYIYEMKGFGKKMPVTMFCFTVGSLALVGIPGFAGFISKWNLASAAVQSSNKFAYLGVAALIVSAILTAIYLFSVVITVYFPGKDFDYSSIESVQDPTDYMKIPLILLCEAMLLFGLFATPILRFFENVAIGLM